MGTSIAQRLETSADLQILSPQFPVTKRISSPKRPNQLNDLNGKEWIQHTKSVWFQRGLGSDHPDAQIERLHPAPFSYQDVSKLIDFFTKKQGRVLDPFCGVASTLKACVFTQRIGTGIELVPEWIQAGRLRLEREIPGELAPWVAKQTVIQGDAREVLPTFAANTFDFVVTSPPYWGILNKLPDHKVLAERIGNGLATRYSRDGKDLANIESYDKFLDEVCGVFRQCHRVMKPGAYMCVIVGDFRHGGIYVAYHADLILRLSGPEFMLHGIIILVQNSKRLYPYGYPYAFVPNVHHQNILVLRKPTANRPVSGHPPIKGSADS